MAKKDESTRKEGTPIDQYDFEGRTAEDYKPEGFDSQEEFLRDMRESYEADLAFDDKNRKEAIDDKKFSAGLQWDPVVLQQREGLPNLVINSIPQFTAQLVGDWRESRKAIKVLPTNDEDTDVASVRGDIIRSIESASRADRVYDSAFESLVQCGDGAFRIAVEYSRDDVFDQDLFIRPIEDALSVVWDRYSVDPTGRDAKRVFVNDRIAKKEFESKWGKDENPSTLHDMTRLNATGWADDHSYQLTEYWRLIERQKLMALFPNGKVFEVSEENMEDLVEQNGGPPVKTKVAWVSYAQMHLVTGFKVLAGPYEYRLNRLPIIRMSGRVVNVDGERIRYGVVRFMKDPVRLKNFWRSVAAESLGYAPKAKWMVTESAVEGKEDTLRKAHTSRDPMMVFNDEAEFGKNVVRVEPPGVEAALLNEANINSQDMRDVTGIHEASLGMKSNETSGKAILARQREGDIASLTFHDNGNAAILEAGDVLNQLMPQIYDGTRVMRTIGEDESIKFVRLNDPMSPNSVDLSVGMFDVSLSTGTSYTTRRVEAAQAMMEAIQVWPNLMGIAGDLVAKAQDWPGADKLAERLAKTIPPQYLTEDEIKAQGGHVPPPEELQAMQQELEQLRQQNQILEMEKHNRDRELDIKEQMVRTQMVRALSDNEVDANQMEMDALKLVIDGAAKVDDLDIRHEATKAQERMHESGLAAKAASDKQARKPTAS